MEIFTIIFGHIYDKDKFNEYVVWSYESDDLCNGFTKAGGTKVTLDMDQDQGTVLVSSLTEDKIEESIDNLEEILKDF